jgi:hypothetical protein
VAAISSEEGKIVIINLYTKEIFRVLFHPDGLPINRILLSFQPFGTVIYYSEYNNKLYVYSVNGQLLSLKKFKSSRITDIALSSDSGHMDFVVNHHKQAFTTTTGEVGVANVPFLENFKAYTVARLLPMTSLCVLPRGEAIVAGDVLGNLHIVFNDSNIHVREVKGAVITQSIVAQGLN